MKKENYRTKEEEIDIFIYSRSSIENMLIDLINKDKKAINFGKLNYEEKIRYTIAHYIQNCKKNPEKIIFYLIQIASKKLISSYYLKKIIDINSTLFPPLKVLKKLNLEDFNILCKIYKSPEELKTFFIKYIILSQEVQKGIKTILDDSLISEEYKTNWKQYYYTELEENIKPRA